MRDMEDITDADYAHAKRVCKAFEVKKLGGFMICIFKTIHYCQLMYFRTSEICLEIFELDLPAPGLAWQTA